MNTFERIKRWFAGAPKNTKVPETMPGTARGGSAERRSRERINARAGTRVLIIDDSATIVALLRRMMKQNAYETFEANDAEQGVVLARSERPDLIFLDIVLPGMNGFAALRQLRRDPLTKDIPIIMMSGNEQATEQFYAHRIGADDFMKKPFSRVEVFSRIERLVDTDHTLRRSAAVYHDLRHAHAESAQSPSA